MLLESSVTLGHVLVGGVWLYVIEKVNLATGLNEDLGDLVGDAERDDALVRNH